MYFIKVMSGLYNPLRVFPEKYRHFESIEGVFYNNLKNYKLLSTNGFAIDLSKLPENEDFRITRFVRDPRDLIVSGYFYHKRGAEPWFRFKGPTLKYWSPINGNVPENFPSQTSFSEYLQNLSLEDGLIAEIEFRKFQLDSMRNWPNDERIKLFKYEEILGNEGQVFEQLLKFLEVPKIEQMAGIWLAKKHALKPNSKSKHVRNASPGQWKDYFTPKVNNHFIDNYGDVLEILDY